MKRTPQKILAKTYAPRRNFSFVAVCFFIVLFFLSAFPLLSILSVNGETTDAANKPIKVGFFAFDGYHNVSETGIRSGYGYEYLQEIAKYASFKYSYIDGTWEENLNALESGEIDLLTSAQKTPERLEKFDFSELSLGTSFVQLSVKATSNKYFRNDYYGFNGIRVGLVSGNSRNEQFTKFAAEKGFTFTSSLYSSQEELQTAFESDKIDAILTSSLRHASSEKIIATFNPSPFYAIVKKGNPLINEVNAALNQIEIRSPLFASELYNKYYRTSGNTLVFSKEEQTYLNSHKTFTAVTIMNQRPLSYFDGTTYSGIYADIMHLIEDKLKVKFNFLPTSGNGENFELLNEGKADFVTSIASDYSWAEANGVKLTAPYMNVEISYLLRKDFVGEPKTIAAVNNFFITRTFVEPAFSKDKIKYYPDIIGCIDAVKRGDADVTYLDAPAAARVTSLYKNNLISGSLTGMTYQRSIGVSENSDAILYSILDKAVLNLSKDEVNEIIRNHTAEPDKDIDLIEFIYRNPTAAIFIAGSVFIAVIIFMLIIFFMRKKMHEKIYRLAYHDPMTGLINRYKLEIDMKKLIAQNKDEKKYAAISLDVKKFYLINQDFSREVGDKIIMFFADELKKIASETTLVSHNNGDNFFIITHFENEADLTALIRRLANTLSLFYHSGTEIKIRLNFGICYVGENMAPAEILDFANLARRENTNTNDLFCLFDGALKDRVDKEKEIETRMETALDNGEFIVYFQPKYNMLNKSITGAEALVRWQNKTKGFLSPADFIPIFEKNGFITELDFYVLEETFKFVSSRLKEGKPIVPISVNQSRIHFKSHGYLDRLEVLASRYRLPPGLIELEITETALTDIESIVHTARRLRELGFKISVDDFGTGYSSLNLITTQHLDVLKLDRSFLDNILTSQKAASVIKKIIEMAKEIDMEVICEGVETNAQRETLIKAGCIYAQGYFFCKPVPKENFIELLEKNKFAL